MNIPDKQLTEHFELFELVLASSIHDMKNSLAALLNQVDRLSAETPEASKQDSARTVRKIKRQGNALHYKMLQLLTLYRLQQQHYCLTVDEYTVVELLQEAVEVSLIEQAESNMIFDIECAEDLTGYFDYELIGAMLQNAIGNAIRYSKGHILLSACKNRQGVLTINVRDDGPGYSKQFLDSARAGLSFNSGNTGLGLYFCAQVAAMHGNHIHTGSVMMDNTGINGGACFTLLLP